MHVFLWQVKHKSPAKSALCKRHDLHNNCMPLIIFDVHLEV